MRLKKVPGGFYLDTKTASNRFFFNRDEWREMPDPYWGLSRFDSEHSLKLFFHSGRFEFFHHRLARK